MSIVFFSNQQSPIRIIFGRSSFDMLNYLVLILTFIQSGGFASSSCHSPYSILVKISRKSGCSWSSFSSLVMFSTDFTLFCNIGWSFFHLKLWLGQLIFSISIIWAIVIPLFSVETKLQVDVDLRLTPIFLFSLCVDGVIFSRKLLI